MTQAGQCESGATKESATSADHHRRALIDRVGSVWWSAGADLWHRRNGPQLTEASVTAAYGPVEEVVVVPVAEWRLTRQELADLRQDRDEAVERLSRSAAAPVRFSGRRPARTWSAPNGRPPRLTGELTVAQWVRLQLAAAALSAGQRPGPADLDDLAAYVLASG